MHLWLLSPRFARFLRIHSRDEEPAYVMCTFHFDTHQYFGKYAPLSSFPHLTWIARNFFNSRTLVAFGNRHNVPVSLRLRICMSTRRLLSSILLRQGESSYLRDTVSTPHFSDSTHADRTKATVIRRTVLGQPIRTPDLVFLPPSKHHLLRAVATTPIRKISSKISRICQHLLTLR